jgi:hypothetical protein
MKMEKNKIFLKFLKDLLLIFQILIIVEKTFIKMMENQEELPQELLMRI